MTKEERKLFNDVQRVMKALYEVETRENIKVMYKPFKNVADIFWPPVVKQHGNGHTKFFEWDLIDALKQVSDKYSISYRIGYDTDNFELVIQIYVV